MVQPPASLPTKAPPPAFQVSAPVVVAASPEETRRRVVVVAPAHPHWGAVGASTAAQEEPLSILPIPMLPTSTVPHLPHRAAPPLPSRLSFAAPAVLPQKPLAFQEPAAVVTDAAATSEVVALRQETAELRRLLTHACAQIDALSADRDDRAASSAQLDARLTLVEGEVKLMHAATPPAPAFAPMPTPNPAVVPVPPEAAPSEPTLPPAPNGIDAPRGVSRLPLGALREAPQPRVAADGGPAFGMPPKLTATTYKSSFAEYVSTQAFISDMSQRFARTQKLLLESPTDFASPAEADARK